MASNPGWFPGYIPSAAEWNSVFSGKLDITDPVVTLGPYLSTSGGTVTGPLVLSNLPTSNAGLAPGTLWNSGGFVCVA